MKFGLLLSICFAAVATIDKTPPAKTQVNSESAKTASTTFATDPCPIGDQRCICPNGEPSRGRGCFGGSSGSGGGIFPQPGFPQPGFPRPQPGFPQPGFPRPQPGRPQDPCPYGDMRCVCPDGRPSYGRGCYGNGGRPNPGRPNPRPDCSTGYFSSTGQCCYGNLNQCCNLRGYDVYGYQCSWGIWGRRGFGGDKVDLKAEKSDAKTEAK